MNARFVHHSLSHYLEQLDAFTAAVAADPPRSFSVMRIAALVKQIPQFEAMTLGADGRLVRDGLELEMNAYCRRAVAEAVELVRGHGGEIVVFTLGPPSADDVLREALAWGDEHGLAPEQTRGVHVCDTAFAGSDTLATARRAPCPLAHEGRFDLVLCGRNSVDADTGQVGPELAELLDTAFVTNARRPHRRAGDRHGACTQRDRRRLAQLRTTLPAVVSYAERLIDPCKVDPEQRTRIGADRIAQLRPTRSVRVHGVPAVAPRAWVPLRVLEHTRARACTPDLPVAEQVAQAVALLANGARSPRRPNPTCPRCRGRTACGVRLWSSWSSPTGRASPPSCWRGGRDRRADRGARGGLRHRRRRCR